MLHAEAQSGEILGVICQLGGQTPLGLAKGIQDAGYRILGTSPEAIDLAEERQLFSDILDAAGLLAPRHGTAIDVGRRRRGRRGHRLPGARAAELRARRARHGDRLRHRQPARLLRPHRRRGHRRAGQAAAGRPLPRRRRSRSTSTRCTTATSCTSAASWSTSKRPASTPATPAAPCRRSRSAAPRSTGCAIATLRDRRGRGRAGTAQRPVRDQRRRALRHRGEPAGEPHGAVRLEGARHPAREGRRAASWPARRSPSSRTKGLLPPSDGSRVPLDAPVAVKEAVLPFKRFRTEGRPHRRLRARPRDALDRRGHGHRPRLPDRVREEPGGRVRRHAADGHRVHLGRRRRQARRHPAGPPAAGARLPPRRDRGHRRDPRAQRHRRRGREQVLRDAGVAARRTSST